MVTMIIALHQTGEVTASYFTFAVTDKKIKKSFYFPQIADAISQTRSNQNEFI